MSKKINKIKCLGLVPYPETFERMNALRDQMLTHSVSNQTWILEHEPVITMGVQESQKDLLLSRRQLAQKEILFYPSDRGGKLTLHSPGQLIVYFIWNIKDLKLGVADFVEKVQNFVQSFLWQKWQLKTSFTKDNPGLWAGNKKIMSLGFRVRRGISSHGIALNINNDLSLFNLLNPCGMDGTQVDCLKNILQNNDLNPKKIGFELVDFLSNKFGFKIELL